MESIDTVLGLLGVGSVSVFGVWFVLRLISGFQRDFTNQYATRLGTQETKIATQDARIEALEDKLTLCITERRALRARLAHEGVLWRPADWGADDN